MREEYESPFNVFDVAAVKHEAKVRALRGRMEQSLGNN
jgi:hypothetical protein